MRRTSVAVLALVGLAVLCHAGNDVAYVSMTGQEPWGMPGNINAMNDVFGVGNWDRLNFPTAVQAGVFNRRAIFLDGGDGADAEFNAFIGANRATMESWVAAGGRLLIIAARWGSNPVVLDIGFGITLDNNFPHDTGNAADPNHVIYHSPFGPTGTFFDGDYLAHDIVYGGGLAPLMWGSNNPGQVILGEKAHGAGWVIAGGLTLPFFGEHPLWNDPCKVFHRNLLDYWGRGGSAPCPGDLDGDGDVDQSDLGIMLADYGCTDGPGNCPGDIDGDGDTDQSDLGVLLANYGQSCN